MRPQEIIDSLIRDIKGTQSLDAIQSANCEAWIRKNFADAVATEREAWHRLIRQHCPGSRCPQCVAVTEAAAIRARGSLGPASFRGTPIRWFEELPPASKPDDVDRGPLDAEFERNVAEFLGFGVGPYSDREQRIIKECVEKGKKAFEETGTSMMAAPDDVDRPADHFGAECNCEFDPRYTDHDDPGDESIHFHRKCLHCGHEWPSLHCPHDGYQNPCPNCDRRTAATDPSNWTTGPIVDLGGEK